MIQGDVIYAKSAIVVGTGAMVDTTNYDPWSTSINDQIALLSNNSAKPNGQQIPLFIGAATNPPERAKKLQWEFGDTIGVFTGKVKFLNGISYSQVTVQLRAYYGKGDDIPIDAMVWVRSIDVTSDQNQLQNLAESGLSGGVTVSDLSVKRQNDTLTNKATGSSTGIINTLKNSSNTIWYLLALALAGIGFWYYKKQDN